MSTSKWKQSEKHAEETIPSRSRLYCLAPIGRGTSSVESLTSYIHRLAWAYRVTPRTLVRLEIIPHLREPHQLRASPLRLGSFGRGTSMSLNGTSEIAVDWSDTLGRLTMRFDLPTRCATSCLTRSEQR